MNLETRLERQAIALEQAGQHNAAHNLRLAIEEIGRLERRIEELEGEELVDASRLQ